MQWSNVLISIFLSFMAISIGSTAQTVRNEYTPLGCMMCHQGGSNTEDKKTRPSSADASINNIKRDVVFLTDKRLEGRLTGSQGEYMATQYVASTLDKLGLEGANVDGRFFQTFYFSAPNDDKKKVGWREMF